MRIRILSLALLLVVLLAPRIGLAGDEERQGTGGASWLRIPVGARALAIGGATVADVEGADAVFWNPAGLAHNEGREVLYSYTDYFADMKFNTLAFTTRMGNGHLGASIRLLDVGDIIVTTEAAPDGTGEVISPTLSSVGVSYARLLTDRVLVGGTVNLIHERILQETAEGVAFDLGFQYLLGAQGLEFGLVIKNLGPQMRYSGGDLERRFLPEDGDPSSRRRTFAAQTAGFELPSHLSLGASYKLFESAQSRFFLNGDFQSNSFSGDEFRGGAEYAYRDMLFLRGGWNQANQDDYLFSGPGLGVGVSFDIGDSKARIDYARTLGSTDSVIGDLFGDLNTLSLSYSF